MKSSKNLGIWMDHSNANLMECPAGQQSTTTFTSISSNEETGHNPDRGEKTMHNKENHLLAAYYKKLGEAIKNYDSVILFGPTDAKAELHNMLKEDHHFDKIKVEIQDSGKMTENQQHAFVKEYFATKQPSF